MPTGHEWITFASMPVNHTHKARSSTSGNSVRCGHDDPLSVALRSDSHAPDATRPALRADAGSLKTVHDVPDGTPRPRENRSAADRRPR